jgi:hypothetical protein
MQDIARQSVWARLYLQPFLKAGSAALAARSAVKQAATELKTVQDRLASNNCQDKTAVRARVGNVGSHPETAKAGLKVRGTSRRGAMSAATVGISALEARDPLVRRLNNAVWLQAVGSKLKSTDYSFKDVSKIPEREPLYG